MRAKPRRHGRRRPGRGLLAAAVLVGGCFEAAPWPPYTVEAGPERFDSAGATTAGMGAVRAGGGVDPDRDRSIDRSDDHGADDRAATTGTSVGTMNAPPVIELFVVQSGHLSEAGPGAGAARGERGRRDGAAVPRRGREQPQTVWRDFDQTTRIPRPSHHEVKIREFLVQFGQGLGLGADDRRLASVRGVGCSSAHARRRTAT